MSSRAQRHGTLTVLTSTLHQTAMSSSDAVSEGEQQLVSCVAMLLPVPASIQLHLLRVDIVPLVGPDLGAANVQIEPMLLDGMALNPSIVSDTRTQGMHLALHIKHYQVEYERNDRDAAGAVAVE